MGKVLISLRLLDDPKMREILSTYYDRIYVERVFFLSDSGSLKKNRKSGSGNFQR